MPAMMEEQCCLCGYIFSLKAAENVFLFGPCCRSSSGVTSVQLYIIKDLISWYIKQCINTVTVYNIVSNFLNLTAFPFTKI